MDTETKRLVQVAVAWCGPVFGGGFIVFWAGLGHNVPPPNMMGMTSAQLISEYYGKYQNEIAFGMIGAATMGMFYTPWSLVLATLMLDEGASLGGVRWIAC